MNPAHLILILGSVSGGCLFFVLVVRMEPKARGSTRP